MQFKYRNRTTPVVVQQLERMPRYYKYCSKTRTLILNGHTYTNVGGDWYSLVNGG